MFVCNTTRIFAHSLVSIMFGFAMVGCTNNFSLFCALYSTILFRVHSLALRR